MTDQEHQDHRMPVWGLSQLHQTPSFIGSIEMAPGGEVTVYTAAPRPESFTHAEPSAALEWLMQQIPAPLNGCIVGRYWRRDPEALQYERTVIGASV